MLESFSACENWLIGAETFDYGVPLFLLRTFVISFDFY